MWLSEFYVNHFTWLSNLTRIDRFFPWGSEYGAINDLPLLIIKFLLEIPFMMIVLLIPFLFILRIGSWMIGCWFGCADDIYND